MKRKFMIPILAIIGIFLFGITMTEVSASTIETLTETYVDNVYWTRRGGGQAYRSWQYAEYSMNGKTVYCIQPGVSVTTSTYTGENGFVNSPYSEEINHLIDLIGYYGYDYPGHQTLRYRMATQALIWEATGGQIIEWWTEQYGYGDNINVDKEKKAIMALANSHYNKPSFNGGSYNGYIGQELTINDTSGILNQFEIYKADNSSASISGNELHVTPNSVGNITVQLKRKHYDEGTTIVYMGANGVDTQRMGYFRASDPVVAAININVLGGKVSITKVDSETNSPQGNATLKGAIYGVYDNNGGLLEKITTDENGNATSGYLPYLGNYTIKEITASNGYELDNTTYTATITNDTLNPTVVVKENVIKRDITLFKVFASAESGVMTAEPNVSFEVYLKSNHSLYKTIKTDSTGVAYLTLPFGTYTFHQITTTADYEMAEDFDITVSNSSENPIYKIVANAPITAKLRIVKVDEETGQTITLGGIKFKIKDLSTNEYVCQTITYPKAKTICEFETDNNGILITPDTLVGDFLIEEVEDQIINGYTWNSDGVQIHIGDGSEFIIDPEFGTLVSVNFANERVKGKIAITKKGEEFVIEDGKFFYQEILLDDIVFELYANEDIYFGETLKYSKDMLISEITTINGIASLDNLELGKYYLKEIDSKNHVLDETKYNFELVYKDQYTSEILKEIELKNYLPKGTLVFTKTDLTTGEVIPNTRIEIYTEEDELVYSGITNEKGQIEISELLVGKYYIKETEASTSYLLSDELVYFEITENKEIVKANMTNKKITGTLKFTKLELNTDITLKGALIEIYDENGEVVYHGLTDEDGTITIENLKYGKYSLKEIEAPEGHELSNEIIYFEIDEDGKVIETELYNAVIVEVPNTYAKKDYKVMIISGVLMLAGIGVVVYGKKRKK